MAQGTAPKEAQPVAPQSNYDNDDGTDNDDVLSQNLDANGFENVANRGDFDFNTKTLYKILCHIANVNPLPSDLTI